MDAWPTCPKPSERTAASNCASHRLCRRAASTRESQQQSARRRAAGVRAPRHGVRERARPAVLGGLLAARELRNHAQQQAARRPRALPGVRRPDQRLLTPAQRESPRLLERRTHRGYAPAREAHRLRRGGARGVQRERPALECDRAAPLVRRRRRAPGDRADLEERRVDAAVVVRLHRRVGPAVGGVDPHMLEAVVALVVVEDMTIGPSGVLATEQVGEGVHAAALHAVADEDHVPAAEQLPRLHRGPHPKAAALADRRRPDVHAGCGPVAVAEAAQAPVVVHGRHAAP